MMTELGYACEHFGIDHNDAYSKPPVLYFEMHRCLFSEVQGETLYTYYADVRSRLLPDEGSSFGYHFRDEDFYLYFLAHEYKHFAQGGTGVRSLVDTYIIMQKYGDSFDRAYLSAELEKLEMTEFEQQNRELYEDLSKYYEEHITEQYQIQY